jgi:choloylglycine hydrolase
MKFNFKIILALIITLNLIGANALACTGIVLRAKDGSVVPARTMEFGFDIHSNILVIPAGTKITKLIMDENTTGGSYTTKYGLVGANALGKPIVVDGINEKGLYFGAFYFNHLAQYQELTVENRSEAISSEELGTYILSQFASVSELKKTISKLVIVGTHIKEIDNYAPFHYAVTDRSGESIVIEITKDGLKIFDNTVNVVTNNPTYDWHLTNLNNYVGLTPENRTEKMVGRQNISPVGEGTGLFGLPGDHSSPSRFVRATAFANSALPSASVDETVFSAFHILNHFDIPKGSIREEVNENLLTDYTVWTSVADTSNSIYYYKTYLTQQVEKVDLGTALLNLKKPKVIKMESGFSVVDRSND